MTPEKLAALKEVAEKVADPDLVWGTPESVKAGDTFKSTFDPTTCLELLEEVERLRDHLANVEHDFGGMFREDAAKLAWNTRADLPRATVEAKWDKSGLKEACQRGLAMGRTRQEFDIQLLLDALLEIERLEATPRATGETTVEWMPIETAPRDARSLLIYCPESGDVFQAYRFDGDEQWRMFNSGGRIIYQRPSL